MLKVRIMRGLPGSGKSCFASKLSMIAKIVDPVICSADSFFVKEGIYQFDYKLLPEAHKKCRMEFLNTLFNPGRTTGIVVDNTNTTLTEMAYYIDLASLFTDDVEILTITPPGHFTKEQWITQCFEKNQHGVPLKTITEMQERISRNRVLPWWNEKLVTREDGHFVYMGKTF